MWSSSYIDETRDNPWPNIKAVYPWSCRFQGTRKLDLQLRDILMSYYFSTDSWWVITLVLMLFTTIPVKIGAELFRARNKDMAHCALAVVLGTIVAVLLVRYVGGLSSFTLMYIAMSIIYWLILRLSLVWSFVFTLSVILIQFAMVQALAKLGMLVS